MANEISCPICNHSLGFHAYDFDTCQAPLGGMLSHEKCGCGMTIHEYIKSLQKNDKKQELEKLKEENKILKEAAEHLNNQIIMQGTTNDYLKYKIKAVSDILNEAKTEDNTPFYGHFKINYKKKMHELIEKASLELEKIDA